jgi:hypothetical protein
LSRNCGGGDIGDGAGIAAISRVPRFWSRRKLSTIGVHSDIPRENSEWPSSPNGATSMN